MPPAIRMKTIGEGLRNADTPSGLDVSSAEVRVVAPVGGREGWGAVDFSPQTARPAARAARREGGRAWLRGYLSERLGRQDRILLILDRFEGLNTREIGAVVGKSEAWVLGRLKDLNDEMQGAFAAFQRSQDAEG